MKFKSLAFFGILSLLFYTGCDSKESISEESIAVSDKPVQKQTYPTFKLQTGEGKIMEIVANPEGWVFKGFEGKAVLLDFFATWCPPCKAEIPHLNNLRKKYDGKFEIIGVLVEQNKPQSELDAFIKEFNITYPVSNTDVNFDLANAVGGVKSIPTMFMFNTEGRVVNNYVGMVPEEMLEIDIKKALNK